jgi:hypothetical protein
MSNNTTMAILNTEVLRLFNNQVDNIQTIGNDFKRQVTDAYPSIYTKEDVMRLLDNVIGKYVAMMHDFADEVTDQIPSELESNENSLELSESDYDTLESMIDTKLGEICYDYIKPDNDSAEFSLDYNNRIELDNVEFEVETEEIADRVIKCFKQYISEKQNNK